MNKRVNWLANVAHTGKPSHVASELGPDLQDWPQRARKSRTTHRSGVRIVDLKLFGWDSIPFDHIDSLPFGFGGGSSRNGTTGDGPCHGTNAEAYLLTF
jgi:hypothetical protein